MLHPEFGSPSAGILTWTWVTLICASAGLVFLYKTTTADPGFLPCGSHEKNGKEREKVRRLIWGSCLMLILSRKSTCGKELPC